MNPKPIYMEKVTRTAIAANREVNCFINLNIISSSCLLFIC